MLSTILFVFVANATFYVVPGGAGSQNGSSWDNAYGNIQTAIDAANTLVTSSGGVAQEVWVKAGTYSTSSAALIMREKVNLYGGFAGTETALSQRTKGTNPWDYTNITTLNGGTSKRCIEVAANFTTVTIIDGFTITNGNGQGVQVNNNGGGVVLRNNLKLQNSIVTGNTATGNGGGINAVGGIVENCWIYNNTTTSTTIPAAGGIYSAPTSGLNTIIESCLIERNAQGGVRVQGVGSATMNACIIRNNTSSGNGAAIFLNNPTSFVITNCLIVNNKGENAITLNRGKLINSTIANNEGGIYLASATNISEVYNNIIVGNVTNNTTTQTGMSAVASYPSGYVKNNAIWPDISAQSWGGSTNVLLTTDAATAFSQVAFANPTSFKGSTSDSEKLTELAGASWKITNASLCKDFGDNTLVPVSITTDFGGNARIVGTAVDAGAYEFFITQLNITGGTLSAKGYTVAELAESHFTLTSGELIIDESASIHSLTLSPSSKLTISTGTLTATNAITLQSDATGTATLKNSGTYSGNITAQQYLGTARNWYVSSPVSSASAPATNVDYYYEYVEAGDNNPTGQPGSSTVYWKGLANGSTMDVGKGYIAKTNAGTTVAFSGTPNNGNITTLFDLTRNESAGKGFNLVGNPYPSYINWTSVAAANPNLDNTYYYRTQNIDNSYAFVTWNGAGNTFVNSKGGTANTTITSLIPPTQAFWVRVKSGTTATKMHFNNDMREHRDDNGNLMKMPRRDTRPTVRMQLQNGNNADEMLIYQDADANNDYDSYDSPKMLNNSTTLPDLYSIVGNERLVINGFGTIYHNMEVPLGFSLKSAASLRIKASELNYLPVGMSVYLLDKLTNTQTQLTSETEYSFTTTEANINNESRFSLVFKSLGSTTSVNESELSKHTVFVNAQNELVIIAAENSRYAIYTIVGEMISAGAIANKALIINSIAKGVYIVNVNNQSSKVIIQ